ncbi:MAG: DUF21 domain-containing protein, partial [Bacteroidales bacterium]|nr:DUF21 domain-containing protein [Bacteroidales bacterium]
MEGNIFIVLVSLLFSAFFSGYEIAFLSGNKLKVELDRKQGKRYARVMDRFIKNPESVISCLLIGNNIALVIYGIASSKILDPLIEKYITASVGGVLAIDTVAATLIVLVTAEYQSGACSLRIQAGCRESIPTPPAFSLPGGSVVCDVQDLDLI